MPEHFCTIFGDYAYQVKKDQFGHYVYERRLVNTKGAQFETVRRADVPLTIVKRRDELSTPMQLSAPAQSPTAAD